VLAVPSSPPWPAREEEHPNHHRATELPPHQGRPRGSAATPRKEHPPAPSPFIGRSPAKTCPYSDHQSKGEEHLRPPASDLGRRSRGPSKTTCCTVQRAAAPISQEIRTTHVNVLCTEHKSSTVRDPHGTC
jgi:hypothetical protein